ncbi:hypothetical protein SLE2022_265430 [Rubroshorea leprosula]
MDLSPPNSSEPPLANPNLPPPTPPPPDISVVILVSSGSDQAGLLPPISHSSSPPDPPVKSFNDTLMDGSASTEPPLVTYEELALLKFLTSATCLHVVESVSHIAESPSATWFLLVKSLVGEALLADTSPTSKLWLIHKQHNTYY